MRGDVLLYRSAGSLADKLICWRTQGPFVHVEVDMGDGTAIGAHSQNGVTRHPILAGALVLALASRTTPDRIDAGLAWLHSRIGEAYSWADIFDHLGLLKHLGVFFGRDHAFDCSHLVAQYLDITGGVDFGREDDDLDRISPNDIYRAWCAGETARAQRKPSDLRTSL